MNYIDLNLEGCGGSEMEEKGKARVIRRQGAAWLEDCQTMMGNREK